MQGAIIVFVKNPVGGQVKTRLAATLGHEKALAIYERLLVHTRKVCLAVNAQRHIFYSNFIDEEDDWPKSLFHKHRQSDGDIGRRMAAAFQEILTTYDTRAILVGGDIPGLQADILSEAIQSLDTSDFCLGPATDGGYYLIGMKKPAPWLFEDMPWSTDAVAKITQQRIMDHGGSCHLLPALSDIDYAEDWESQKHLLEED